VENWVTRGVAAACLAWLALTGVVYLVGFLSSRRREHGWLAVQSLLAAAYPLWVLDLSGQLVGDAQIAALGGALALACAASVSFTHAHFGLASPGRIWSVLAGLGVVAGLLVRAGFVRDDVMAVVSLLVIAAAVAHQVEALWRLARGATPRLNARLLLGAWVALGAAVLIDGTSWLAMHRTLGGRDHLGASIVALTALAFVYTVALARQHGLSLEQAERQSRELETRLDTIETKSREIDTLNQELRRQIALRSRQLTNALTRLGSQHSKLTRGTEIAGRYRVIDHLGSGGMGMVYEVARLTDDRRFALKLLHGNAETAGAARFAREAEILAQLDHPNLVAIVDIDVSEDGQLFIVMDLVEGVALDVASPGRAGDLTWCSHVLTEIAAGLVAIHSAGIVHRDLKPANILVAAGTGNTPVVKIADFGVSSFEACTLLSDVAFDATALLETDPLTATGVVMGTPRYMAPELVGGARSAGFPIDVFSFGVLAYELLAGQSPYREGVFALRLQGTAAFPPRPLAEHVPNLPAELSSLVHDCLAWDGAARPTAITLLQRLRALPAMPAVALRANARPPTSPTMELSASQTIARHGRA
jgi:serine/threonine-protein kinase